VSTATKEKPDLYREVTDRIVGLIEEGLATGSNWMKPWAVAAGDGMPTNASTHAVYRGINVLMLWAVAVVRQYPTNEWASYKQWASIGAQVKPKGDDWPERERYGTGIVYANKVLRKLRPGESPSDKDVVQTSKGPRKQFRVMKWSTVFNAAQVDGYKPDAGDELTDLERIEECDRFVQKVGAKIKWGEAQAAYVLPPADLILMPKGDRFQGDTDAYYSTLFHELTHWTGIKERMDRPELWKPEVIKGTPGYAMEELVAEFGAAFQCARHGIEPVAREDHAEYIAGYGLKLLRENERAIVTAAARATDATNYLFELAGEPNGEE